MENVETQKWVELARDDNPNSRKLALDLAPSISNEIQDELMLWFLANENYEVKKLLHDLLNKKSREIIAEINKEKIPTSLNKIKEIELLDYTKDEALKKTILKDAIRKRASKTASSSILRQIKDYQEIKQCSLKEARLAIEETLFLLQKRMMFEKLSASAKKDGQKR